MIAGIDPGLEGAIAFLDDSSMPPRVTSACDLPISGTKASRQVEGAILADMLQMRDVAAVVVEQVGAMPGQGVASMFRFGYAAGEVSGVVKALRIPLFHVTPSVWKRHFGLIGKDKEASRQLAIHRFPNVASSLARKKDDGRAEAILIAAFHAETRAMRAAA